MSFLERVLEPPSYGFVKQGEFYVPSHKEILKEFFSKLNVFADKKNWLACWGWSISLSLAIPLYFFITHFFSLKLLAFGFIYGMVLMGSHGTFWLHRYGTHRAFTFRHPIFAAICRNLVIRSIPEEIYVVSHHVHHKFCEKPGDPYNVHGGWLYCFLADATHQGIRRDLNESDYSRLTNMLSHTGVRINSYSQYQRWGSLCNPFWTILHYVLNWGFWFSVFYSIGGFGLATALFGGAGVWIIGVRTYNFEGHGKGRAVRGATDFNKEDLSINQMWPGIVAGEWHNNHHLYPSGARSGFMKHQIDLPWYLIFTLSKIKVVSSYRDYRDEFLLNHGS
jgi:fatty-acid desaturase